MQTSWTCFVGRKAEALWDMSQIWTLYTKILALEPWDPDTASPEAECQKWADVVRESEMINPKGGCSLPEAIPPTPSFISLLQWTDPIQKWVKRKPTRELCIDATKKEKENTKANTRKIHHERKSPKKLGKIVVLYNLHKFQMTQWLFKKTRIRNTRLERVIIK